MSYLTTVLTDSPAGLWRLSEAAGTSAADDSGHALAGTYTGTPTLGVTGPLSDGSGATATGFDGVDDLVDIPDDTTLDGTGDFSLEIWFKTGTLVDPNAKLFWKRTGGNGYALHITTSTGFLTFECETGAVNNQLNTSVTSYSDGNWHHAVATRSGANGSIYIDGALVAGPTALTSANLANTAVLRLGSNDTVTRRFVGSLFGAAVYPSALSAGQVLAHYTARMATTAAYDALLAADAPKFIVLAEVQALEQLGPWTKEGAYVNVYSTSFLSQVRPTIGGGLYRRLDSVIQDATSLTIRASAALVDANLGSYYLDAAANTLYVSTTGGLSPDTYALVGAKFTLFFSTTTVSFSDRPLYEPRISALPEVSATLPDQLFGAQESDTGQLALTNTDGLFDTLCRSWIWRNKPVVFKLGGSYDSTALAYADYVTVATLRVNKIEVTDELAVLSLEDFGSVLNRSLPPRTWGDGTPAGNVSESDIYGKSQPLVFGAATNCPLSLGARDQGGGGAFTDYWYAFDAVNAGLVTIGSVFAVDRATRSGVTLTPTGDYTVLFPGNIVAVTNSTYTYDTYDILANLDASVFYQTFGQCAQRILFLCGEDVANVDSAAFAAADVAAPQPLARFVDSTIQASDLMTEILQSVRGQVYRGTDGRWTCRLLTEDIPDSYVSLSDADFVTWTVQENLPELAAVLSEVRVRYNRIPYNDNWTEVSSSDDTVAFANETTDSHRIDTWLTTSADASVLAQRHRFRRSVPAANIQFELRGLELMTASVGDLVAVTRDRGPIARTGRLDGQFFRIVALTKSLGPEAPTVSGVLSDLDGQTDHIFRLAPAGSTLDWSTATAQEKAVYGFLADSNGYLP